MVDSLDKIVKIVLKYLLTNLTTAVLFQYQLLASRLFQVPVSKTCEDSNSSKHALRTELFELLASHFPEHMTHPRGHLIDMIPYPMDLN